MTTATPPRPPVAAGEAFALAPAAGSPPGAEHRVVTLDVRPGPDVLTRVLGLLLRRRCTVTRVDFVAADRHRPGRLTIGYEAPAGHADRAVVRLDALVDVLGVRVSR